jgi:hypothetical protein
LLLDNHHVNVVVCMDCRGELEHTARLLAEAEARIEQQMQHVAELETATLKAKAVLRAFEDTRLLILSHRETLIRQLSQDRDAQSPPALQVPATRGS